MSKSTGKSSSARQEKVKLHQSQISAAAVPDIIPGKFSENDWLAMLEKDSAEDFVVDYIDEILAHSMVRIQMLYLKRQLVSFAVLLAVNEALHIVEWNFLGHDGGEGDSVDTGWIQDEEPNAAVMDSWAQGAVPRTEVITSFLIDEAALEGSMAQEKKNVDAELTGMMEDDHKVAVAKSMEGQPIVTFKQKKAEEMVAKQKVGVRDNAHRNKARKRLARPCPTGQSQRKAYKTVIVQSVSPKVSADTPRRLSAWELKKALSDDVKFDSEGNVVSVMKMDASDLPSHKINVKYHLVEPRVEASKPQRFLGNSLTPKRSGVDKQADFAQAGKAMSKSRKFIPIECPPSLMESINVVAGVTVSESGRQTKLSKRPIKTRDNLEQHLKHVRPIAMALRDRSNTFSVADLLDRNPPHIRSLEDSKPLPPIMRIASNSGNVSS